MDGALRPVVRCQRGSLPNPMRRIDAPRVEQRANDWLRPFEDRALQSAPIPQHERFLVLLLRWTGLRVGEAVSLAVSDVDLTRRREAIYVRSSKTPAGRRAIPVLPMLLPELRDRVRSISNRTGDFDAPILITRNGTAMKPTYVWRAVKRASFRAGVRVVRCECDTKTSEHDSRCPRTRWGEHVSRVSPHTLRQNVRLSSPKLRSSARSRIEVSRTCIDERDRESLRRASVRHGTP